MIYICVPVFNRIDYTIKFLKSLRVQTFKEFVVIICDDNSTDGTFEKISDFFPEVVLLKGDGNLWWTGGINMCIEYVLKVCNNSDFVLTLNNDTELDFSTIQKLYDFSINNNRCIVGGVNVFYNERHRIEPSAFRHREVFPFRKYQEFIDRWGDNLNEIKLDSLEVDSLSGKGVLIPVEVYKVVGLYNFKELPHYHADTEFIRRAQKQGGFRIFILYKALVFSHQEQSGLGQINTPPSFNEFIKSFFTIKSTNHFVTIKNRAKLIYQPFWRTYLVFNIFKIILGFFKRFFIHHITRIF